MEQNVLKIIKISMTKTEHLQYRQKGTQSDPIRMKNYMETETVNSQTVDQQLREKEEPAKTWTAEWQRHGRNGEIWRE